MIAVEQGLLPHQRSLAEDEEIEEERRLCFVGMTRAKEELSLCHAKMREFRGQTLSTVPSMFLGELPTDGIDARDMTWQTAGQAIPSWRSGPGSADAGWSEAGVTVRRDSSTDLPPTDDSGQDIVKGAMVRHDAYGTGRVIDVQGFGKMRTVKIRFPEAGERSFRVEKAKLTIV